MAVTRRAFVGNLAAPPVATTASRQTPAVETRRFDSSFDPRVEVHAEHLRRNVAEVSRRGGGRPILAVIKLHEAIALRDEGVRKPVLLMGPFDERDIAEAAARDIELMVYTPIGDALVRDLATRPGVRVTGTMMTFTEDPEFDREQLRRFQALCAELEAAGVHLGLKHAASSSETRRPSSTGARDRVPRT